MPFTMWLNNWSTDFEGWMVIYWWYSWSNSLFCICYQIDWLTNTLTYITTYWAKIISNNTPVWILVFPLTETGACKKPKEKLVEACKPRITDCDWEEINWNTENCFDLEAGEAFSFEVYIQGVLWHHFWKPNHNFRKERYLWYAKKLFWFIT